MDERAPTTRNYEGTRTVRKFFYDHPGLQVWLSQIHDHLHSHGITMSDSAVRNVIARAISENKMNLEVIARGQSWVYRPAPAGERTVVPTEIIDINSRYPQHQASLRRFVERMTTRSGRLIIEDATTGTLYEATELDL